jgi:hypothetical protein
VYVSCWWCVLGRCKTWPQGTWRLNSGILLCPRACSLAWHTSCVVNERHIHSYVYQVRCPQGIHLLLDLARLLLISPETSPRLSKFIASCVKILQMRRMVVCCGFIHELSYIPTLVYLGETRQGCTRPSFYTCYKSSRRIICPLALMSVVDHPGSAENRGRATQQVLAQWCLRPVTRVAHF